MVQTNERGGRTDRKHAWHVACVRLKGYTAYAKCPSVGCAVAPWTSLLAVPTFVTIYISCHLLQRLCLITWKNTSITQPPYLSKLIARYLPSGYSPIFCLDHPTSVVTSPHGPFLFPCHLPGTLVSTRTHSFYWQRSIPLNVKWNLISSNLRLPFSHPAPAPQIRFRSFGASQMYTCVMYIHTYIHKFSLTVETIVFNSQQLFPSCLLIYLYILCQWCL